MAIRNVLLLLLLILLPAGSFTRGSGAHLNREKQAPPPLMLWCWSGDDDFRPLADAGIGVAYLALSLDIRGASQVLPKPRMNPVWIPASTYKMVVIRFDYQQGAGRPAFSRQQRELAVRMVGEIAALARPQAVQIDFDAPESAWPFYRELLTGIRNRLEPDMFLSITALVSWCETRQSWMAGLPVDEIVPMAFYMGRPTPAVVTMLQRGGQFAFSGCRSSIGVHLPNPEEGSFPRLGVDTVRPRRGQRVYFFPGYRQWSPEAVSAARKAYLP